MGRRPLPGRLRALPAVAKNVDDLADDDDALIRLHEILFGVPGSKSIRKKNVLSWSSKEIEESPKRVESIRAALSATPLLTVLKEICVMLDLNVPMGRAAIEAAIFDFLIHVPHGKEAASPPAVKKAPAVQPKEENVPADEPMEEPTQPPSADESDDMEDVPPPVVVKKRVKRGGRKKGSRNKTPEEKEALRLAKLMRPRGKPGRKKGSKNNPALKAKPTEMQRRGRPLNFNEMRAFRAFVKNNFPDVFQKWAQMPPGEQESYWVRHRYDI